MKEEKNCQTAMWKIWDSNRDLNPDSPMAIQTMYCTGCCVHLSFKGYLGVRKQFPGFTPQEPFVFHQLNKSQVLDFRKRLHLLALLEANE